MSTEWYLFALSVECNVQYCIVRTPPVRETSDVNVKVHDPNTGLQGTERSRRLCFAVVLQHR